MNCRKSQHLLVDYLEDSLSGRVARSIRLHLEACDVCRQKLQEMKRLREHISRLPVPELSEREWDAFQRALSEKLAGEIPLPAHRSVGVPAWKIAGALAAAACVFVIFATPMLKSFLQERNRSVADTTPAQEVSGSYSTGAREVEEDITLALANFSEEEINLLLSDPVIVADNGWETVNEFAGFGLPFGGGIHEELAELSAEECEEMLRRLESLSKGETS